MLREFGPPENLVLEEVPDLAPGPGQVRIDVRACGVHLIDTSLRAGGRLGGAASPGSLPQVPGREAAGTVDLIGDGVAAAWFGRRVVVHLGPASGGYAAQAVCDATRMHAIPQGLSDGEAVALIGTGRTALGILDRAAVSGADTVLVTAAAGGLGALLVQASAAAGATVVGVAGGPEKVELVTRMGAQVAVDYAEPGWPDRVTDLLAGRSITVALDGVGGEIGEAALRLLGRDGRLLMFGWSSGRPIDIGPYDLFGNGLTVGVAIAPQGGTGPDSLRRLEERSLEMGALGSWRPLVTAFPLDRAADAHTALTQRRTTGKVVLVP